MPSKDKEIIFSIVGIDETSLRATSPDFPDLYIHSGGSVEDLVGKIPAIVESYHKYKLESKRQEKISPVYIEAHYALSA